MAKIRILFGPPTGEKVAYMDDLLNKGWQVAAGIEKDLELLEMGKDVIVNGDMFMRLIAGHDIQTVHFAERVN